MKTSHEILKKDVWIVHVRDDSLQPGDWQYSGLATNLAAVNRYLKTLLKQGWEKFRATSPDGVKIYYSKEDVSRI